MFKICPGFEPISIFSPELSPLETKYDARGPINDAENKTENGGRAGKKEILKRK